GMPRPDRLKECVSAIAEPRIHVRAAPEQVVNQREVSRLRRNHERGTWAASRGHRLYVSTYLHQLPNARGGGMLLPEHRRQLAIQRALMLPPANDTAYRQTRQE